MDQLLDIDDVLCLNSPCGGFDAVAAVRGRHVNPAAVYGHIFAPDTVRVLRLVHDAMAGTPRWVIICTWRELLSREELSSIFRHTGLGFVADGLHEGKRWCTPPKFDRSRRVDEILQWLDRYHQSEPFAIIDDTLSGASRTGAREQPRTRSRTASCCFKRTSALPLTTFARSSRHCAALCCATPWQLAELTPGPVRVPLMLLLGPPGVAKTLFSHRVAALMGASYAAIAFDQPSAGAGLRG